MKTSKFAAAALVALVSTATLSGARADPGGCLKYGAVGAVGGHYAGHHAVLGAVGGCAVGMWHRHHWRRDHPRYYAPAYDGPRTSI